MPAGINESNVFILNFYIYKFLKHFAFVYAVYLILFKSRGLSVFEISLLLGLWSACVVFFEVPTGALADKWNRKYMMIIGLFLKSAGFAIWLFADNFFLFALGFFFWGLQETFCSGTEEALLYDTLKKFKRSNEYPKIAGQGYFYAKISAGSSIFLGGFIAAYDFSLTIFLSSLFMLFAIIPILSFKEVARGKSSTEEKKYFNLIKNAFRQSAKNKRLLRLIIYSLIVLAISGTLDEYQQLYFDWIKIPLPFFGIVIVSIMFLQAFGNKIAHRFHAKFQDEKNIYYLSLLAGICLLLAISWNALFSLFFFILLFFWTGISEILIEDRIQQQIKTEQRATMISINSLLLNSSAIVLTTLFGITSIFKDLRGGFLAFALIMIFYSLQAIVARR